MQPDRSIVASGKDEAGVAHVRRRDRAERRSPGSGSRCSPDGRLPNRDRDAATDGNFVLNEFEVTAAPKADPKQAKPVKLENAAGRLQPGRLRRSARPSTATRNAGQRLGDLARIRGRPTGRRSRPRSRSGTTAGRADHQAAPQVQRTAGCPGRFRLSVTRVRQADRPEPAPRTSAAILAVAPEVRTEAQKNALLAYFRAIDPECGKDGRARPQAKAPLPVDPQAPGLRRTSSSSPQAGPARPARWPSCAATSR